MKPFIDIQVPDYRDRSDYRYGTLTCWEPSSTIDNHQGYLQPAWLTEHDGDKRTESYLSYPVLTRASYDDAAAHGNPEADPTRPYGHLPRGVFKLGTPVWHMNSGETTGSDLMMDDDEWEKFGPVFIPLLPVPMVEYKRLAVKCYPEWAAYYAFTSDKGFGPARSGLGLHGGPLDSEGRLRCTNGCGRGFDDDAVQVAKWVERVLPTVDDLYALVRGMI